VVLVGISFLVIAATVQILRSLRTIQRPTAEIGRFRQIISNLRQALNLLLLGFGIILSDMVFTGVRTFENAKHFDIDTVAPFDGLCAFAFVVLSVFFFLVALLWRACSRVDTASMKNVV
jgi:hypothetical protein